ncbi:MAG TPA: ammonium transporter, partial [Candidatus Paceibacterota bacterium]|nr:ammonium transporter [Candidatus Paceibacterota bacterium]
SSENRKRFIWHSAIWIVLGCVVGYIASFFAGASSGGDAAALAMINSGDTAWMLASTALVMIMTPAVGFFYGGMVSSKNVLSVIKQSMIILALISIQWVVVGYSLAFGPDAWNGIIGNLSFFGLHGVGFAPDANYAGTIPALVFMIFQAMFAIITPALIIGAFVERIKFRTLVVFTLLWATLVYDPVAHWVWSPLGWLHTMGALDFAGGTVVHMTAGFSALAAALLVGKRLQGGSPATNASNLPFVILGAALLWFGWFGFNAGSALASGALAASAFVVTNTAAAAAALVWVALSWAENGRPSAMAAAIGAVCGLVVITPASGFVGPVSAIAMGLLGGAITYLAVYIRGRRIKIDDSLDVWAGHGIGGLTGALLTGVFAEKAINSFGNNGLLFGNAHQLLVQLGAVLAVGVYSFLATWIILKVLSMVGFPLRVTSQEEEQGLDMAVHGEPAYRT